MQLEIEALKLFDVIVFNFSLVVKDVSNMIYLLIYIIVEVGGMGDLFFLGV